MSLHSNHQIPSLTGLRFFAAALVVIFHFARPHNAMLMTFIGHGALGVAVFFVLSGFILSYSYSLGPGSIRGDLRSFWAARFARLYPVYLVGVALFAPIVLSATREPAWRRIVTGVLSLTVTQAWFHLLGVNWGMWNPPGWSLSAEAFFYLLFPFVCLPLSRLSPKSLLAFAVACWAVSICGIFTHRILGLSGDDFWAFVPVVRLPEFLIGMAAGLAWKNRRTMVFDIVAPFTAVASVLIILGLMALPISEIWSFSGAVGPLAAVLICSLACQRGRLARFLSYKPVVTLGCASYSLYILHWPLWLIGKHFFGDSRFATQQPNMYFIAYFIVSTAAAYLCFRCVEEPMNRFLRRKLMQSPAPSRTSDIEAIEQGAASGTIVSR